MKFVHKILFFITFLGVLLASACNQDKGTVTPNVLRKLDKVTLSDGNFSNYTYDANGRVSRIDNKTFYETYTYNASSIIETNIGINGTIITPSTFVHALNAQGVAISSSYTINPFNHLDEYERNAEGFITRIVFKYKSSTATAWIADGEYRYTYDSDGDLITGIYYAANGAIQNTVRYEYDKNHYNTVGNEFAKFEWYNRGTVHFITKITSTPQTGAATVTNYTAIFDKKGYIISRSASGTSVITGTYTYK